MAKYPPTDVPPLRVHKGTGQAYVLLDGRRRYLGRHDLPDAKRRYDQLITEWLANGRWLHTDTSDLAVVELTKAFMRFARSYFATSKNELAHFKSIVQMLNDLYGSTNVTDFGPSFFPLVMRARKCPCSPLGN